MECIACVSIPADFSYDLSASCFCMFVFFEDQNSCSLCQYKSFSVCAEWKRSIFRILSFCKCFCVCETCQCQRKYHRLRTAGYDCFCISVSDGAISLSYGVCRCCACSHDRETWTVCLVADSDISGCYVGNHCRDEKRGNPLGTILENLLRFLDLSCESSDSRSDIYTESEWVDIPVFFCRQT